MVFSIFSSSYFQVEIHVSSEWIISLITRACGTAIWCEALSTNASLLTKFPKNHIYTSEVQIWFFGYFSSLSICSGRQYLGNHLATQNRYSVSITDMFKCVISWRFGYILSKTISIPARYRYGFRYNIQLVRKPYLYWCGKNVIWWLIFAILRKEMARGSHIWLI